jgi:ATP-binding cassette subfamily B (MDR/TAP) protein 1
VSSFLIAHYFTSLLYVIDEATSALDASSRILVFEAVKRWRRNRTTVVITHDLSQITPTDFIYVLKGGELVEQGYRADLESGNGAFKEMVDSQGQTGGFLPEKVVDGAHDRAPVGEMLAQAEDGDGEDQPQASSSGTTHPTMRPMSLANWMFEAVAKLTDPRPPSRGANPMRETLNRFLPADAFPAQAQQVPGQVVGHRRPSSVHIIIPPRALTSDSRRLSLQFSPATPTTPSSRKMSILTTSSAETLVKDDGSFEFEKDFLKRNGEKAAEVRTEKRDRTRWDADRVTIVSAQRELEVKEKEDPNQSQPEGETARQLSFWQLLVEVYPTIPYKPFLFFGLFICILSGAMTPLFSFVLSRLLFEVSTGAKHTDIINRFGGIVLGVAAADGLLLGLKYFVMETNAISWVTHLRKSAFELVLAQDKKWFDKTEHSAPSLVQLLIKDGDDARSLIAAVIGQCLVVVTMVGVGLTWALVRGWQLTLVGFAITPVFVGVMAFLTTLIGKYEARNKQARLEVAKGYYEVRARRCCRVSAADRLSTGHLERARDPCDGSREYLRCAVRGCHRTRSTDGCPRRVRGGMLVRRRQCSHLSRRGAAFLRWGHPHHPWDLYLPSDV